MLSVFVVLLFGTQACFDGLVAAADETTDQLIEAHGCKCERHRVETADGYILTVHRIVDCPKRGKCCTTYPLFLQHGFWQDSAAWMSSGPVSIAYELADLGCDVWLGNARGTRYSQEHKHLTTSDPGYWEFSWHEMGIYDLPAVIDHMLKSTGSCKVSCLAYSMGTTMFFVLHSTLPEYNDKVHRVACLAPVTFMSHSTKLLTYTAPFDAFILKLAEIATTHFDETSIRTLQHYLQCTKPKHFAPYDNSTALDLFKHSGKPPNYDLTKITCEMFLYYGEADPTADPEDVKYLNSLLRNKHTLTRVNDPKFNHSSFMAHQHLNELLYNGVVNVLINASCSERAELDNDKSNCSGDK